MPLFHQRTKCMYTCMRLTTPDGRFATANFFPTFSIFCKHTSKFTCDPIFPVPDRKNRCRKLDVWCRKLDLDTCEQRNINEKVWKIRHRKSAVGCREPHTTLNRGHSVKKMVKWAGILNGYQSLGLSTDRPQEAWGGPRRPQTVPDWSGTKNRLSQFSGRFQPWSCCTHTNWVPGRLRPPGTKPRLTPD